MGDKPATSAEIIKQDDETLARMRKQSEERTEARIASAVALAVASAYWIAAQAIATTPFRCHAEEDRDFHSGCVQTKDAILDAVRALTPADAQAALARFKADAVREALERFKLLSVAWRAKVEEGTMPTNKEIGYLNCADQIDSLIAELEKEN